jgi:hypothetical protein
MIFSLIITFSALHGKAIELYRFVFYAYCYTLIKIPILLGVIIYWIIEKLNHEEKQKNDNNDLLSNSTIYSINKIFNILLNIFMLLVLYIQYWLLQI